MFFAPFDGYQHFVEVPVDPRRIAVCKNCNVRANSLDQRVNRDAICDASGMIGGKDKGTGPGNAVKAGQIKLEIQHFCDQCHGISAGLVGDTISHRNGALIAQQTVK